MADNNSKNNSEMIKLGLVLALYAAVSCSVLALVNNFTSPKIENNQKAKINASMKTFFPEEDVVFEVLSNFEKKDFASVKVDSLILARKDDKIIGGACQVSGPTYDQGTLLVGMALDGQIKGVKFLKLSDSPGFGLKANDPTFTLSNGKTFCGQFEEKNAKNGFISGETFDGISGATITSKGVANLLTAGTQTLFAYFEGEGDE